MAGADIILNIFARDHSAEATLKRVGKAAAEAEKNFLGLRKSTLILAAATAAPLAAPLVTSMLAMSAAMAEGVAGMAVMKVGLVGMGDAFKAVGARDIKALDEAMGKLAPSAQGLVLEFQRIKPALTEVRKQVQEDMFAPMANSLIRLSGQYVPMLRAEMPKLAHDVGLVGSNFSYWAVSNPVMDSLQHIIAHTGSDMLSLSRTVQNGAQAFLQLADSALPFMSSMLAAVERGTAGWRDWVSQAQQSGKLSAIFGKTSDTMDELGHTISILSRALGDLFANPNTVQAANNLIHVMNLGLQVVGQLAAGFSHLSNSTQLTILTSVAAALVIKQLAGGMATLVLTASKIAPAIATGLTAFSTFAQGQGQLTRYAGTINRVAMGAETAAASTTRFGTTLAGAAGPIGLAVAGIGGLFYIVRQLGDNAVKPTEHNVDALAKSLVVLGQTGKTTGEAVKVMGTDMSEIFRLMNKISAAKSQFNNEGSLAKVITGSVGGSGTDEKSINQFTQNFKELDKALAQLAQGGMAGAAADVFANMSESWTSHGFALQKLTEKFPAFTAAQEGAVLAASGAGHGFATTTTTLRLMTEGLAAAVHEAGSLVDLFDRLNGGAASVDHANLAFKQGLEALAQTLKDNGTTLDAHTLKGLTNRDAFEQLAHKAVEASQAIYANTGSLDQAQGAWQASIDSIRDAAKAAGFNTEQMKALNEVIGKMPAMKATQTSTPGAVQSEHEVEGLDNQIKALKDKLASVNVVGPVAATSEVGRLREQIAKLEGRRLEIVTEFKTIGRPTGSGHYYDQAATGGLIGSFRGFASGGYNGPVYGPGTGTSDSIPAMLSNGEYVIKAASVASVGLGALNAINSSGMVPAVAVGGGGGTVNITINSGADVNEVVRAIRKFVRIDGGGDVQTALGRS